MSKNTKLIFNKKLLLAAIKTNVSAAIEEDLKSIDKTSEILPTTTIGVAKIQEKLRTYKVTLLGSMTVLIFIQ